MIRKIVFRNPQRAYTDMRHSVSKKNKKSQRSDLNSVRSRGGPQPLAQGQNDSVWEWESKHYKPVSVVRACLAGIGTTGALIPLCDKQTNQLTNTVWDF